MIRFNILPYEFASESAKLLMEVADTPRSTGTRLRTSSPRYRKFCEAGRALPEKNLLINWGKVPAATHVQDRANLKVLNANHVGIARCVNKIEFFQALQGSTVNIPAWTTDAVVAQRWLNDEVPLRTVGANLAPVVVERTHVSASEGRGIRLLVSRGTVSPQARLWTRYVKKAKEYRVHVARTGIISAQLKFLHRSLRRRGDEGQFFVRNTAQGWRFTRIALNQLPDDVTRQATNFIGIMGQLGIDFCALDIIYNERAGVALVLEANTAPGLSRATARDYVRHFADLYASVDDATVIVNHINTDEIQERTMNNLNAR